ncbi:MAG: hypothetical protein ACK5ML_03095 [Lachnospiraceae bacterium]
MELIFIVVIIISVVGSLTKKGKKKTPTLLEDIGNLANDIKKMTETNNKTTIEEIEKKYTTSSEYRSSRSEKEIQKEIKRSKKVAAERQEAEQRRRIENEKKRAQEQYQRQLREKKNEQTTRTGGTEILNRSIKNVNDERIDEIKFVRTAEKAGIEAEYDVMKNSSGQAQLVTDIYDLLTTGYQVKFSYERDFLAEGMDMLNRVQAQP